MFSYAKKYGEEVKRVYGNNCWYCGEYLTSDIFSVDHFEPRKYGGSSDIKNLRPCCRLCNTTKSNVDIETFRLRIKIRKAELPKFINTTILKYFENEHGFSIDLPEHIFYFETGTVSRIG